jgi:hypothetical protein
MRPLRNAVHVLLCTLREIFDEAAYARFLQRTQTESSAEAYAAFWREKDSETPRRIKCC